MTETSDERREVAKRLRKESKTVIRSGERLWTRLEIAVNGWKYGDDFDESYVHYNDVFARLADLIDPTCKIVTDQVDDGEWGAHETYVCCSNCGNQNMFDRFTRKPHRFCPHCGARVVSGNESGM